MAHDERRITYPAVYEYPSEETGGGWHALGASRQYVVGCGLHGVSLSVYDRACDKEQFRIEQREGRYLLQPLSLKVPTLCDGRQVEREIELAHGMEIQAGNSRFLFATSDETHVRRPGRAAGPDTAGPERHTRPTRDDVSLIGRTAADGSRSQATAATYGQTIVGRPEERASTRRENSDKNATPIGRVVLSDNMVVGRDATANVHLDSPHVSRIHVRITQEDGPHGKRVVIADQQSTNGTFVNGSLLKDRQALVSGDVVGIGPYVLRFDGAGFDIYSLENDVHLKCHNLKRIVKRKENGVVTEAVILDDVSLEIPSQSFVCLIGPSGSGKSTLLKALSARVPADEGIVEINGMDFYENFDQFKQRIALVDQKDVLHDVLPMRSEVDFTAKLRFAPGYPKEERQAVVAKWLKIVDLEQHQNTTIGRLSGGQLKRASLANEIISEPSLLFLDEVTSGLDEETDREMMALFERIAKEDKKTVICVTHSLTNVPADGYVTVLTKGGKLAFFGTHEDAKKYFKIQHLGEVYRRLEDDPTLSVEENKRRRSEAEKEAEEENKRRGNKAEKQADAVARLIVKNAKVWEKKFREFRGGAAAPEGTRAPVCRQPVPLRMHLQVFVHQLGVLVSRYFRIMAGDVWSLVMVFGQCLLVAALLSVVFGNLSDKTFHTRAEYSGTLLFLMAVSCLWFGCNNSAKEIVKERVIYERERNINLVIPSYYGSKLLLLGLLSILQALILLAIVKGCTDLAGSGVGQAVFLSMLALVGVTMGLLISAASNTSDLAITVVPMVLIPQIALANVLPPIEGWREVLAQVFITAYWGYRGLATIVPTDVAECLGSDEWSASVAFVVLALQAIAFAGATLFLLYWDDPRKKSLGMEAVDRLLARAATVVTRRNP